MHGIKSFSQSETESPPTGCLVSRSALSFGTWKDRTHRWLVHFLFGSTFLSHSVEGIASRLEAIASTTLVFTFKSRLLDSCSLVAFLFLVAMPGAPRSVLVPSSKARSP